MNKRKWSKGTQVLRIGAAILLAAALLATPVRADAWSGSFFESVKSFVQSMYIEGKTDDQLMENALKGMFSNLDDYSSFMNQEETKAYEASLSGQFSGIGAQLEAPIPEHRLYTHG